MMISRTLIIAHRARTARRGRALRHKKRYEAGFTLIEVIVVLSIMSLIMSMVGPRVLGYLTDSKVKAAKIQVETLASSVELFYIDNGRYPLEAEGLKALVEPPPTLRSWNGPYLKGKSIPVDPWGKPYQYASPDRGRTFVISILNPDGGEEQTRRTSTAARQ